MSEHIVINLDETLFVPECDLTLLQMVKKHGGYPWPSEATCVTQECDGAILWWSAPVCEVVEARKSADISDGLIPLLGIGDQVSVEYYQIDGKEVVALDWKESVVTLEQYESK